jgi:hypothetical protein
MTLLTSGWLSMWMTLGLAADPINAVPSDDYELLYNGKDFGGWLADPATLAHWKTSGGEILADGKGGNLVSEKLYRDFELRLDWKVEKGSTGGVFLRGRPRVAIGDPDSSDPISGGLVTNLEHPNKPTSKADNPAGQWNTFRIELVGNVATVFLNDQLVVEKVILENDYDRSRRIPVAGPIELEAKGPITFRNIYIRPIAGERPEAK